MPLRFTDACYVQTGSTTALQGATAASVSFWFKLHAGTGVATGDHGGLLGSQFFTPFVFYLIASTNRSLVFRWQDDQVRELYHTLSSAEDATYHVVATLDSTTARLHINGLQVAEEAMGGPIAAVGGRTIDVGPSATGLDLSIDDPTIWQGYVLSGPDILALRDRTSAPEDIAPGNIAWRLTLDGTPGAAATVGDPGLEGLGSLGADVATVSAPAPIYGSDPLAYNSARVRWAGIGASGKTLALLVESFSGADLANLTAMTAHPTISVNGGAPVQLADPIWGADASDRLPYVVYPLPVVIAPTDAVTVSAPDGWASTAAEQVGRLDATPVSNGPDRSYLPPFVAGSKAMAVGYNLTAPNYWHPVPYYANAIRQASRSIPGDTTATFDQDGYPTAIVGSRVDWLVSSSDSTNGHDTKGYPGQPPGIWTVCWDGASEVRLGATLLADGRTGGVQNIRTYDVTRFEDNYYLALRAEAYGPDVRNLRVYPPGVEIDGASKWHPSLLRMLSGARCLRFMDAQHINSCNVTRAEHFQRPTALTPGAGSLDYPARIVSVAPEPNADGYLPQGGGWYVARFTTESPHGFSTGQTLHFGYEHRTIQLTGGATQDLYVTEALVRVLSPTEFACSFWSDTPDREVDGTQVVDWPISLNVSPGLPHEHMLELSRLVGADAWVCVPHALEDAGVATMAATCVASLPIGRKLRVEYTNEHWNYAYPFKQFHYLAGQGRLVGLSQSQWYAKRAGEVHAIFAAAFASVGRAGDLIRVFGAQGSSPEGPGREVVEYCAANGIPIDELAIAPYLNNGPAGGGAIDAAWSALDIDQLMDCSELYVQHHWYYTAMASRHAAVLHAQFPAARVVCYEGGPEDGCPRADPTGARSRAWGRHPRLRGIMLQFLQQLQDQDCPLFVDFLASGTIGNIRGATAANWAAYLAWDMQAGLGDGSDGQFDNRTDFEALDQIVSVVGGAIDAWEALVPGGASAPPGRRRGLGRGLGRRLGLGFRSVGAR